MKKAIKRIFLLFLLILMTNSIAQATATVGGIIVSTKPAQRKVVIKLKSGGNRTVILIGKAKAYKMNQATLLYRFRVGEYAVFKLCSPLNEKPWRAEIIMDNYSSRQYTAFRTISPVIKPFGGGYATTAGAASTSMAPLRGVYPGATTLKPGDVALPKPGTWNPRSAFPVGNAPLKAAPSPWGSPAMGSVLSPSHKGNSGGGGSVHYNTGPATPQSTKGGVNYNTGPSSSISNKSSANNPIPGQGTNSGITPAQGAWVVNPTAKAPKRRIAKIQGRIISIDPQGNLNVIEINGNKKYLVTIRRNTKITDYMTGMSLSVNLIRPQKIANITGIAISQTTIEALKIQVQR